MPKKDTDMAFTVRIDAKVYGTLRLVAAVHNQTTAAFIRWTLEKVVVDDGERAERSAARMANQDN